MTDKVLLTNRRIASCSPAQMIEATFQTSEFEICSNMKKMIIAKLQAAQEKTPPSSSSDEADDYCKVETGSDGKESSSEVDKVRSILSSLPDSSRRTTVVTDSVTMQSDSSQHATPPSLQGAPEQAASSLSAKKKKNYYKKMCDKLLYNLLCIYGYKENSEL